MASFRSSIRMSYCAIVLPYEVVKMYNFVIGEKIIFQHSHELYDIPGWFNIHLLFESRVHVVVAISLCFEFSHESSRTAIPRCEFFFLITSCECYMCMRENDIRESFHNLIEFMFLSASLMTIILELFCTK